MALVRSLVRMFREIFLDKMPLAEFDSYDQYWNTRSAEDGPLHPRYELIAKHLPEAGCVLDLGCGDGRFLRHLKAAKPALQLCGVDGSSAAIETLREAGIDGEVIDLSRDSFAHLAPRAQFVTIMEVIEHIENAEAVMRKILDLKPTGVFVTIPNLGFIGHRLRLAIGGRTPITTCILHIREHVRFWTVSDFRYWAAHLGFRVLHCHGQSSKNPFWRAWPGLWCRQVVYVLEPLPAGKQAAATARPSDA
jgi:methionine biosynthesis protein MetW